MKEIKRLKLNQISKSVLQKRDMDQLQGGWCCGCGCNGSSSSYDNQTANWYSEYGSPGGNNGNCWVWPWEQTSSC